MATSVPLFFKPQVPVTPPPDQQHVFTNAPFPSPAQKPGFAQPTHEAAGVRPTEDGSRIVSEHQHNAKVTPASIPAPAPASTPGGCDATNRLNHALRDPTTDPRYLAMASRIASYYQQRCQAVANFQQQRCQVWANAQRQKCQEMMQAAMLIVAWYIRDRISRRRRRQRRVFKRGLKQKERLGSRNRITKGESVRRWVMGVPLGTPASPRAGKGDEKLFRDKEEEAFEMDKEDQTLDKDSQLFDVADGMIKSQLARIDVPLLGLLSFDESDDESESESEDYEEDEELDDNFEQAGDDEMDNDEQEEAGAPEQADSKSVHVGTSTNKQASSVL